MIEHVEFPSDGATLRGLLYRPESSADAERPLVVMAHGTSATIGMVADRYAETFCRAGFAVLLYDHRTFGRSEGEPRQEINPWVQCRGFRDAVTFAQTLGGVDRHRIALWGDSYTGGQVVVVGAVDERVKAIVAQVPIFGAEPPRLEPSRETLDRMRFVLEQGDVRGTDGTIEGPMPVVSSDQVGTPSLLKPIQAFRWFIDYGGRPGSQWVNAVTRVVPDTAVPFHPSLSAPFVTAPTLLVVAPDDEMVHANYAVARAAYESMPGPRQWNDIAGGHFGLLYWPGDLFDEASRVQTEFLERWL